MNNISIPIAVSLVLGILYVIAAKSKLKKDDLGSFILNYAIAIKLFGMIMFLFGIWGTVVIISIGLRRPDDGLYILIFVVVFCFVFLPSILCIEFFFVEFRINDSEIAIKSPWSKKRKIQWNNVTEILYSPSLRWFTIRGSRIKPIRVGTLISGISVLIDTFERNLSETTYKAAIDKYKKSYRDREEPRSSPLPHHAAYGSVLRGSADQAGSDPGEHKSE